MRLRNLRGQCSYESLRIQKYNRIDCTGAVAIPSFFSTITGQRSQCGDCFSLVSKQGLPIPILYVIFQHPALEFIKIALGEGLDGLFELLNLARAINLHPN